MTEIPEPANIFIHLLKANHNYDGENLFRDAVNSSWDSGGRYTIYIHLFLE
ncbi:hypothetical protein [Terrimonas pollutisoli]|uniref:hypothetical protein n=1 Tax=Terrimonas pollutisoli TaxID=3034147 RepID=UPI0023EA9C64|nr:hypothetical protein [Terrimonas sp. H1YJ31]